MTDSPATERRTGLGRMSSMYMAPGSVLVARRERPPKLLWAVAVAGVPEISASATSARDGRNGSGSGRKAERRWLVIGRRAKLDWSGLDGTGSEGDRQTGRLTDRLYQLTETRGRPETGFPEDFDASLS